MYMAWISRRMPILGAFHDASIYWVTGKSIAEGHGYRIASLPEQPWQTKYPPLFPMCLSLIWRIAPDFPQNLPWATLFCWMMLPVWIAVTWRVFADLGLKQSHALGLCAFLALSQTAVLFSLVAMPEVMFSSLWMASALVAARGGNSTRWAAAAGLIGGAAYLTKSAAIPLLLAVPLCFVLRRQWRAAMAFATGMLPCIAGWNLWMRTHAMHSTDVIAVYYTNYLGWHFYNVTLSDLPSLILKNFDRMLWGIGSLILGIGSTEFQMSWFATAIVIWRVLAILTIFGTLRHARRIGWNPFHIFTAGYLLMLWVWHYPPNERFIFPVLPVLLAGFWTELCGLGSMLRQSFRLPRAAATAALAALACVCLAITGYTFGTVLPQIVSGLRDELNVNREAYGWISRNTPADAKFLAYQDPILYLYTGRTAFRRTVPTRYFYREDRDGVSELFPALPAFARDHGLEYLVATSRDFHGEFLPGDLLEEARRKSRTSPRLQEVFRVKDTAVYRILDRPAAPLASEQGAPGHM
jgi:hypothetical protein